MNIVIPAAGRGSRFPKEKYSVSKPLISVNGIPMLVAATKSLGLEGTYYFILKNDEYSDIITEHIRNNFNNFKIIKTEDYTQGSACTSMLCKEYINNEEELIIANCDQIMNWDSYKALCHFDQFDGGLITIKSTDNKHSFVQLDKNNLATRIEEKIVISDIALTGIHYWKKGKDFISSTKLTIDSNLRSNNGEFYIGPTYNMLIKQGKKIGIYMIDENQISFIGTPKDLEKYESRKA